MPANRFYPLGTDAATLAVLDVDSVCGLAGDGLVQQLPLRLYVEGARALVGEDGWLAGWLAGMLGDENAAAA